MKQYVYCIQISSKDKYLWETWQANVSYRKALFLTYADSGPADLAVVPATTFTYISLPTLLSEAE